MALIAWQTRALASFRKEVREVLASEEVRTCLRALSTAPRSEELDPRPIYRRLGRDRLLAPNWPVELGGRGLGLAEAAIVLEEMIAAGVPDTLHVLSAQICGNFVLRSGTDDQRSRFLPAMARGDLYFTVLYTETGAGSDLAALETEARPDGGALRLHGRKVHNPKTSQAQFGLCAARLAGQPTETGHGRPAAKYAGLTLFIVPLDSEGLSIRPVPTLGPERFHQVDLAGVAVGRDAILGEPGRAWGLISAALRLERLGLEYAARAGLWLHLARRCTPDPTRWASADLTALGRLGAEVEASRLMSWQAVEALGSERLDDSVAAMTKWHTSSTAQRVGWWAAERAGLGGALTRDDRSSILGGRLEVAYSEAPGLTLSAGTSEIMLQIVASGLESPAAAGRGSTGPALDPLQQRIQLAVRRIAARTSGEGADPGEDGARWRRLAELGVFAFGISARAGGLDLGQRAAILVAEELGRALAVDAALDTMLAGDALERSGAATVAPDRLRAVAEGRLRYCVAGLTFGSQPLFDGGDGPRVELVAGRRQLAGTCVAAFPDRADALLVVARSEGSHGVRCFSVPASRDGWARRPLSTRVPSGLDQLTFSGLALLPEDEVGLDAGLVHELVARGRLRQAAYLTGLAAAAHELAVTHAHQRRQFRQRLLDFQSIGFRLAETAIRIRAAQLSVRHAALLADTAPDGRRRAGDPRSAEVLALAAELALDASREALQVLGAAGLTRTSPAQRTYLMAQLEACRWGRPVDLFAEAGRLSLEDTAEESPDGSAAGVPDRAYAGA